MSEPTPVPLTIGDALEILVSKDVDQEITLIITRPPMKFDKESFFNMPIKIAFGIK